MRRGWPPRLHRGQSAGWPAARLVRADRARRSGRARLPSAVRRHPGRGHAAGGPAMRILRVAILVPPDEPEAPPDRADTIVQARENSECLSILGHEVLTIDI